LYELSFKIEILQFYIIAFTGKEERRSPSTGAARRGAASGRMDANPAGGAGRAML
jgi:hypothetical protein